MAKSKSKAAERAAHRAAVRFSKGMAGIARKTRHMLADQADPEYRANAERTNQADFDAMAAAIESDQDKDKDEQAKK